MWPQMCNWMYHLNTSLMITLASFTGGLISRLRYTTTIIMVGSNISLKFKWSPCAYLACLDNGFSALHLLLGKAALSSTADGVTRHMLPIIKEKMTSLDNLRLLKDDVSNGWLCLRQGVERIPIRAYRKKALLYLAWVYLGLYYAPRQTADVDSTSRTIEGSAWHAYEPSCRRDATQYGLRDARISTNVDASGLLERAIWGFRWGLIYRDIRVAFVNLEPMDCASCGDYLIRQKRQMPPARCSMAPWEQHGGLEPPLPITVDFGGTHMSRNAP